MLLPWNDKDMGIQVDLMNKKLPIAFSIHFLFLSKILFLEELEKI